MLTHWIWSTEESSARTRLFSAMETMVVSRTAATPPMISAVSARRVSGASTAGACTADAPRVLLITLSFKKLAGFL